MEPYCFTYPKQIKINYSVVVNLKWHINYQMSLLIFKMNSMKIKYLYIKKQSKNIPPQKNSITLKKMGKKRN